MAVNKVTYGGNTLIDLTGDSVTASTLGKGITAHDKSGAVITGTADVLGYIDANKNIVLSGNISASNYTVKYTKADGTTVNIGALSLIRNEIPLSINKDGSVFGTNGILNSYRWNSSGSTQENVAGACTGLIPVTKGDTIYLYDVGLYNVTIANEPQRVSLFNSSKSHVAYWQPYKTLNTSVASNVTYDAEGQVTSFVVAASGYIAVTAFNATGASTGKVSKYLNANSIITINTPIS